MSHTYNNAGNELVSLTHASHCHLFRKRFQAVIQYKGGARDIASNAFGCAVKDSGGVRFFRQYEQIVQLNRYGLDKVLQDIVKPSHIKKFSKESCKSILKDFDGNRNKAKLAMAMIETAAVSNAGHPFCKACYTLEGDSPLILSAQQEMNKLDNILDKESFPLPSVDMVVEKVARLFQEVHSYFGDELVAVEEKYKSIQQHVQSLENKLRDLVGQQSRSQNNVSSRGRVSARTERAVDTQTSTNIGNEIDELKNELSGLEVSEKEAQEKFDEQKEKVSEFEREFKYRTVEELLAYCQDIVKPCAQYYTEKFNQPQGDLYRLKKAVYAAQIFDPFFVKDTSVNALNLMADELTHFGYRKFSVFFINELKQEIPTLKEEASKLFDWESVGKRKQYKSRSQRRAKKKSLDGEIIVEDWKQDVGEKASRIWEWWRVRIYEAKNTKLEYFAMAVRVVVLTQLSSCAIERIFSQLKLIVDSCGENMFEDMLEIRMRERNNGKIEFN